MPSRLWKNREPSSLNIRQPKDISLEKSAQNDAGNRADTKPESAKSKSAKSQPAKQRLQSVIDFVAQLLVAVGLMIWGAFNLWINVLAGFAADAAGQQWWVSIVFIFITALVPFLLGVWLLMLTSNRFFKSQ